MHSEEEAFRDGQAPRHGAPGGPDGLWTAVEVGGEFLNGLLGGGRVDECGEGGECWLCEGGVEGLAGEAGGFVGGGGEVGEDLGDEFEGEGVHFVCGLGIKMRLLYVLL